MNPVVAEFETFLTSVRSFWFYILRSLGGFKSLTQ